MGGSFTNLSPVAFMVLAHLLYGNACAKGAGENGFGFGLEGKGWCLDTFGSVVGKCWLVGSILAEDTNQFFVRF